MRFFRFIYILIISLYYKLDDFIFESRPYHPLRITINVLCFWRIFSHNNHKARSERLRLSLETLGPIFVKFGQMLSTRRDLLPQDIADELAKLQDKVPPFAFEQVEKIITEAFKQPLHQVYPHFDKKPIASASVAQVHFAQLADGNSVAVKVLRPNIEKIIHNDIKLIETFAWMVSKFSSEGKRLKPREIVDEFSRHIRQELDLTLEAANCSQLARNFKNKRLLVPEVHWDFCRKQVMTMQRMQGTPISQIETLRTKNIDLTKLAHEGVEIFFTQVFRDGFFHADMHPGNIQVADDGRYIALDFGIMGSLNDTDKYYLARNFLAFFNRDYRDVAVAHIESGWVPKNTNVAELENAIRAICEPIFNKPLKDISFGRTLLALFQMSRRFGVVIQPQLVMLQKTLLNVEGLGRDLDPSIDLWLSAKPFLKRWMSQQIGWRSIAKTLKKELPAMVKTLPEVPRLMHEFLAQRTLSERDSPLHKKLEALILTQNRQAYWQKKLTYLLGLLIISQAIAMVYFILK